jgi:zinc transport system substrate-binding protein
MTVLRECVRALAVAGGLWAVMAPAQAELKVVVTSKPIHALVAGVMSGAGTPALLVDGPASPHTYAMKPSDAQKVHQANVFFRMSEGLESFTAKLVKSLPSSVRVATLEDAQGLKLLERRSGGSFEEHGHGGGKKHGHGHDHGGEKDSHDPHVWLDPDNAKAMVNEIVKILAEKAPEHAETFTANAAGLNNKIDALTTEIERELKPLAGKPFIVFHDAYQYLERRFGLTAAGSVTINPEVQPSGKRLAELRRTVMKLGATCVFAEPHFEPKLTNAVVEGTRARFGTLDPEGTALQAGPDLYFALMRNLAGSLKACLGGS